MAKTVHQFWSHSRSFCLIFLHLKESSEVWDTWACKLHWTLRSHWLALQGLFELSAHWVCSMKPSPKCSFLRCSWCVHIGVNKRNLLVQWRCKFVCKVTQSTSTTFLLKIEQKDLLDFDTSEPIKSPMVAFLDVWAPQLLSWTIWKRKKWRKVHKDPNQSFQSVNFSLCYWLKATLQKQQL